VRRRRIPFSAAPSIATGFAGLADVHRALRAVTCLAVADPPLPAVFIAMAGLVGLLSAGQAPLPVCQGGVSWFDERRGLALGIAMTGIGIGATLVPQSLAPSCCVRVAAAT